MEQNNLQNQPNDNPVPVSGGLAKRLAEAADGLRDGATYYMLSKLKYPYALLIYTNELPSEALYQANVALNNLNEGKESNDLYYRFGPYMTEAADDNFVDHDRVEIKFLQKNGVNFDLKRTVTIDHKIDAVVFSLAAFDKFFIPYYSRLYGAEKAAEYRVAVSEEFKNLEKKPAHGDGTYNYFAIEI